MEALWAGWRSAYVSGDLPGDDDGECLFCRLAASDDPEAGLIVARSDDAFAVLNRFPYTTGHVLVAPVRHKALPADLNDAEVGEVWRLIGRCQNAMTAAMHPDGFNIGANIGRGSGAGIPGHLHIHVVPRWSGDTNFMTATANTRVLPQALEETWQRIRGELEE